MRVRKEKERRYLDKRVGGGGPDGNHELVVFDVVRGGQCCSFGIGRGGREFIIIPATRKAADPGEAADGCDEEDDARGDPQAIIAYGGSWGSHGG